jgi:hypothetical protein
LAVFLSHQQLQNSSSVNGLSVHISITSIASQRSRTEEFLADYRLAPALQPQTSVQRSCNRPAVCLCIGPSAVVYRLSVRPAIAQPTCRPPVHLVVQRSFTDQPSIRASGRRRSLYRPTVRPAVALSTSRPFEHQSVSSRFTDRPYVRASIQRAHRSSAPD